MAKVIKTVALVAIAAAVIVFAAPIAAGLTVAGSAVFGASFAIAASAVVGVGLSIGLMAVGTLFRKAPSLSQSIADRLQRSVVASAPRKIIFGRTAAGNDERFFETHGGKKDRHAQVIALASHKCSIKEFYVENDLTWNGALVAHMDGIASFRAVDEGAPSNAAALGSGSYWTPTASFIGCAYLAITYKLDAKAWPQGLPSRITTVVEGCPVYDPRLDSTNGGAGEHRLSDQSTWGFHHAATPIGRNPALCLLVYLLGWRINGKLAWGMGIPASRINFDNIRAYANVCEERVQTRDGGTTQRYTSDGILSTADSHEAVLSAITATMGSCKLTDVGGQYALVGGFDDTLGPKQAFSEDDLIGGVSAPSPFSWLPAGPSRETYNIVRGQFANPADLYQLVDWGQVEVEPLADGVPRTLTLNLGLVDRADTCQRIAKQFLAREAMTPGFFTANFGPRAFAVQVGSLVTLSLPAMGWNSKLFRVQEQHETHDLVFKMTLREESSEVYQWDKDETKALPASVRPPGYDASATIVPELMSLTSEAYVGVA